MYTKSAPRDVGLSLPSLSTMAREGQNLRPSNETDGAAHLVRSRSTHRGPNNGEDIELQNASGTLNGNTSAGTPPPTTEYFERGLKRFLRRFKGEGRRVPGWSKSIVALLTCSGTPHVLHQHLAYVDGSVQVLNVLFICLPISWVGHFVKWTPGLEFTCKKFTRILLEFLAHCIFTFLDGLGSVPADYHRFGKDDRLCGRELCALPWQITWRLGRYFPRQVSSLFHSLSDQS